MFIRRLIIGIPLAIAIAAIARGVVSAFSLDEWTARMILVAVENPHLASIAWILGGIVGLIALIGWIALRIDDRIYNWWSPQPILGSLYVTGKPTLQVRRDHQNDRTDVVMAVDLYNSNERLVAYHADLRATVNKKDLPAPITFDAYIAAKGTKSMFVSMDNIPNLTGGDVLSLDARLRYNVIYYFPENSRRSRRTSKFIQWTGQYPAFSKKSWKKIVDPVYVKFADEIEE